MKHYPRQLVLCALGTSLLVLPLSATPRKSKTTVINGKRGSHRFQLQFVTGPFRRASHKIQVAKGKMWLDGTPELDKKRNRNWRGTQDELPEREFYSFQVTVDGRKWDVPARLWADCYEPELRTTEAGRKTLEAQLSRNGKQLTVFMRGGGEGTAGYYVTWLLRANGRHSRTFEQPGDV